MYFSCTRRRRPVSASGDLWHCKKLRRKLANSHHTPTQCKPSELGIDRRQQPAEYKATAAADSLGVSYVARTAAASPPRGPVRGGLHGKSMHLAANRGRVCVRAVVRAMGRSPRPAVAAVGASKGCARALEVLRKSGQDP